MSEILPLPGASGSRPSRVRTDCSDDPLPALLRKDPTLLTALLSGTPDERRAAYGEVAELLRCLEPRAYTGLPLPRMPTCALPGSPEKVRVMRARLARKEHPHHPGDATIAGTPRRGLVAPAEQAQNGLGSRSAVTNPRYRAAATAGRVTVEEGVLPPVPPESAA